MPESNYNHVLVVVRIQALFMIRLLINAPPLFTKPAGQCSVLLITACFVFINTPLFRLYLVK